MALEGKINELASRSKSREELWVNLIRSSEIASMVEVGVFKGDFSREILKQCSSIEKYYMIDPWRHLDDWNKPANISDEEFEETLLETIEKTDFAAEKRIILRGKTAEVIDEIRDGELDFAYIDGDHTLRGITLDLIRVYPKVKAGGYIGGDDFSRNIWQHRTRFEPTLVFPFAVFFAEAVGAQIYGLPYAQFLIAKKNDQAFDFVDLTGNYKNISLSDQFHLDNWLNLKVADTLRLVMNIAKRAKALVTGS
jgi:hypothetical protein